MALIFCVKISYSIALTCCVASLLLLSISDMFFGKAFRLLLLETKDILGYLTTLKLVKKNTFLNLYLNHGRTTLFMFKTCLH